MTHTPGFFDFFVYIMLVLATLLAQSQSAPINPRFYAFSSYIGPVVNLTFDDPAVLRVVSNDSRQRRENTNTWCCVVCSHPDQFRKFRPFSYDIYLPFFVLQTAPLRSTSKLIHLSIFFLSWKVKTLGVGSLRYPGGSTTSFWNYSSGRWIDSYNGDLANRTRAFPRGTFTPDKYMNGLGGQLKASLTNTLHPLRYFW